MNKVSVAYFADRLWYGRSALAFVLLPLSWIYAIVVISRRWFYRRGWLASGHPGVPVVVIGNISVGGTGKTPLVAWLAERLQAAGLSPGIVSRGYGGQHRTGPVLVGADSDPRKVGDEPVLLARRTAVPVAVCRDRLAGARMLAGRGANVIVADDGLQHYALGRDVEIAVIDARRELGNRRLLPAGPLREPVTRLREVDFVFVNGGADSAERRGYRLRTGQATALQDGRRCALSAFAGRRVWAVAGIGHPERFHDELQRHGIEVTVVPVADHGTTDLRRLRSQADWPVLMTEKDAVKYLPCDDPQVWYLPVDVDMPQRTEVEVMNHILSVAGRDS